MLYNNKVEKVPEPITYYGYVCTRCVKGNLECRIFALQMCEMQFCWTQLGPHSIIKMQFLQMECKMAFLHSNLFSETKWGSMVVKGLTRHISWLPQPFFVILSLNWRWEAVDAAASSIFSSFERFNRFCNNCHIWNYLVFKAALFLRPRAHELH